jgi:hypothetical protein
MRHALLDDGGVPSAEQIVAEYQHLEVGDEVLLTPDGNMSYPVGSYHTRDLSGTCNL